VFGILPLGKSLTGKRQGTIGFPSVSARPLSITIVWRQWFRRCFYGRRKLESVT